MTENVLYYGDNLDILRRYVKDETIDLVYLDPPFNSKATYNVLFKEQDESRSAAQIRAFEDTWRWAEAAKSYDEVLEGGGRFHLWRQVFGCRCTRGGRWNCWHGEARMEYSRIRYFAAGLCLGLLLVAPTCSNDGRGMVHGQRSMPMGLPNRNQAC